MVFYLWSKRDSFVASMPDFPAMRAMVSRVLARSSVQTAMKAEGLPIPVV